MTLRCSPHFSSPARLFRMLGATACDVIFIALMTRFFYLDTITTGAPFLIQLVNTTNFTTSNAIIFSLDVSPPRFII
jgi:hypothetical protein